MNQNDLIISASKLNSVSQISHEEYLIKSDILFSQINSYFIARTNNLNELIGDDNIDMVRDNHSNHLKFLANIIKYYDAEVFVSTILWVFRAYRSHGFSDKYWVEQMKAWDIILKENLTVNSLNEILPFYKWIQVNIDNFVMLTNYEINIFNSKH